MDSRKATEICDSCLIPLGVRRKKNKRVFKRRVIDPITNKLLFMCNACGLRIGRAGWRIKRETLKIEKDVCVKGFELFSKSLCNVLRDNNADRLYCPAVTPKLCQCIQHYLIFGTDNRDKDFQQLLKGDILESINKEKANELNELHKKAKQLIKMKVAKPVNRKLTTNELMGIVKLRTKEYEQFVLINRERLKKTCNICERGVQRILCYSNNYLHKQLKTSPDGEARIASKSSVIAKLLPDISTLSEKKCCSRRCTRLVVTHSRLVERWRSKALRGQREARVVLAEMLTPAGGAVNCPTFLRLVTGCSSGLLQKVKKEMKQSAGVREPPEHGLREYWRRKKNNAARNRDKSNRVENNSNNIAGPVAYTAVINRSNVITNNVADKTLPVRKPIIMSTNYVNDNFESEQQILNESNDNFVNSRCDNNERNVNTNSSSVDTTKRLSDTGMQDLFNDNISNSNCNQDGSVLLSSVASSSSDSVDFNENRNVNPQNSDSKFDLIQTVLTSAVRNSAQDSSVIATTSNTTDSNEINGEQRVQFIEITKLPSDMPAPREETVPVQSMIILTPGCLLLNDSLILTS